MPDMYDEDMRAEGALNREYFQNISGVERLIYRALVRRERVTREIPVPDNNKSLDLLFKVRSSSLWDTSTRVCPRKEYQHVLEPYRDRRYPLNKVGLLARVTEDRQMSWINTPYLTRCLNTGIIGLLFHKLGYDRKDRIGKVAEILARIGTESYSPEWSKDAAKTQIDGKIESSTHSMPHDANRILARTLVEKIIRHFRERKRVLRLMDVGTGTGNTIIPLIEVMHALSSSEEDTDVMNLRRKYRLDQVFEEYGSAPIPRDFHKYLRIYLVDVSKESLVAASRKVYQAMPGIADNTPAGGIVMVNDNFLDLEHNPCLDDIVRSEDGKLDIIVSGAAICHQTRFQRFFRLMRSLLRDDGVMHIWDWYNGPSFAAPVLRLNEFGGSRTVFYIVGQNGENYCKDVPEEGGISLEEREELYDRLEHAKSVRVVYEMDKNSNDPELVHANLTTWLGFLGYIDMGGFTKIAHKIQGKDVDDYFTDIYHKYLQMEQGFSFFHFLSLLEGVPPLTEECAYFILEGTGVNYRREMLEAGFSFVTESTMPEVHRRGRSVEEETISGVKQAHQIRYTFARR